MDTKNSLDLPEPRARSYSAEEREQRRWNLLTTFTCFVTFYACIHKVFIPVFLKFTALNHTLYSHIQYSVVFSLALATSMWFARQTNRWISFLCGAILLLGIDEIYQTVLDRHQGWFAFSRLLSSIPLAIAAGVTMSKKGNGRHLTYAWSGVLIVLAFVVGRERAFLKEQKDVPLTLTLENERSSFPNIENTDCGAMQLTLNPQSLFHSTDTLSLSLCGFWPSTILISNQGFKIKNTLNSPVNIHLLVFEKEQKRVAWNILVPASSERMAPPVYLKEESIGILYSDLQPGMGLVALSEGLLQSNWKITRKPLKAIYEGEVK